MIRIKAAAIALWACTALAGPLGAETMQEALVAAYQNNPTLVAQRAALRALDANVPQAISGWRPTVAMVGTAGRAKDWRDPIGDQTRSPVTGDLSVTETIYNFGRTAAQTESAEAAVKSGRARLTSTEQTILLQVITAYMDVVRDTSLRDLNRNNEQVLRRQLDAANDRFRVGEITKTDVSQAESRLSRATADRIQAEGNLTASRANYRRVVGHTPHELAPPMPEPQLPSSDDEAMALAQDLNPDLLTAKYTEESSRHDVDAAFSNRRPIISVVGDLNHTADGTTRGLDIDTASITARVTVPLYQSGSEYSIVRQRKETANQRRIEIDDTFRQVRQTVTRAWEALNTARANIIARKEQERAAGIALDGVTQEAQVGSRTTLDVLDAEQESLDAQSALVTARRDEYVAAFTLLSAVGQLTAERLALPVKVYDPVTHYQKVRNKWIGTEPPTDGADPAPEKK